VVRLIRANTVPLRSRVVTQLRFCANAISTMTIDQRKPFNEELALSEAGDMWEELTARFPKCYADQLAAAQGVVDVIRNA
jgi:hypothetical protein